jgi:hypothetical protein
MYDDARGLSWPRENSAGRGATLEADVQAALALSRAAARVLLQLSPESAELFKVFLQREIDQLKLAGPGTPDLTVLRLREFLRD